MQPIIRSVTDNSWVFVVLLVVLILLGVSRWVFQKNYETLGNLNLFVENQENFYPFSLFVNIILGVLTGLIFYPFVDLPFDLGIWTKAVNVTIVIFCVLLYFLFRFLINGFLVYMLGLGDEFKNMVKVKVFFRAFTVFALIACNFLLYYSDFDKNIILYISLGFLLLMLVLEYFYQLRKTDSFAIYGSYYFILYLCVLEILPVLIVIKQWTG